MVKTPTVEALGQVASAIIMANLWLALLPPHRAKRIFIHQKISKVLGKKNPLTPAYHDHTIFFDDDGKVYMIYGVGKLKILELKSDLSGKWKVEEKSFDRKRVCSRQ
jgi:beta-xylosidase